MARLALGGVGPPVRPLDRAVFEEYLDRDFENLSAEAHSILAAAMEFDGVASTLTAEKRPAENADTVAYDTTGVSTDSEAVLTTCRRYLSLSASPQATIRRPAIAPQMGVQSGAITPEPLGPQPLPADAQVQPHAGADRPHTDRRHPHAPGDAVLMPPTTFTVQVALGTPITGCRPPLLARRQFARPGSLVSGHHSFSASK
jgi:hypothetical protein